jgi:protein SCO1
VKKVRLLLWAAVVVAGLAAFSVHQLDGDDRLLKGELGHVPAFSLRDQHGKTVTDQDLRGSVWVANFVFTRCGTVCPTLTAKFKALQTRLDELEGVRFVSISVDPEHDTPEVLKEYAARYAAGERWHFLTGPLADIERTVVQGFKVHRGEPTPNELDPSLVDIMHGEHFVLVDREGTIRGYYRAEQDSLKELEADVHTLTGK